MAAPCARRSPLTRSGLTQAGRQRAELRGDHFRIDERDIADLILFGRRYAKYVRFHEVGQDKPGDWSSFFENDISASLAALSKLPVEAFVAFQRDLDVWLKAMPERDPQMLGAHFKLVFHLPMALLQMAGSVAEKLPLDHALALQIGEMARRDLAAPIAGLIGWYKGATEAGPTQVFADEAIAEADYKVAAGADPRLRLSSLVRSALLGRKRLEEEPVSSLLTSAIPPGDWAGIWQAAAADTAPYLDASPPQLRYEQIYDALEYNLFDAAIRTLYRAAARLKQEAQRQLEESLEDFAGHLPHYGLWLAFLRLFDHARASLNGFTDRHLDFYFRDVLRLEPRAPEPDRVNLLFELAKGVDAHLLPAGTLLRAGKDALGRPVSYALDQDFVVNRGRIAERRAIRVDPANGGQIPKASTDVCSLDGLGEEPLLPDDPAWPAFGPKAPPAARLGFAVADRKLFLREGSRTIRLTADLQKPLHFLPGSGGWTVRLTGPKGWWEATGGLTVTARDGKNSRRPPRRESRRRMARRDPDRKGEQSSPSLEFLIELDADAPPIIPFDPKLHGEPKDRPGPPRLEILFDFSQPGTAEAFEQLRFVVVDELELDVEASGLKQLSIVGGGATVDPAKPFAPFGNQPRPGDALVVGSSEIFAKPIDEWSLSLDWQEAYNARSYFHNTAASAYVVNEAVLKNGKWQDAGGPGHPIFGGSTATFDLTGADLIDGDGEATLDNAALTAASVGGFVRLTLSDDFGHGDYPLENARALVLLAKDKVYNPPSDVNASGSYALVHRARRRGGALIEEETELKGIRLPGGLPLAPYDPIITRIEASYRSEQGPVQHFVHLHPFGEARARPNRTSLFPRLPFAGALLIGVADFDPPARLSLLVQVADGSGDPLMKPPPLRFDYLQGDQWRRFDERDVDDKTNDFACSGLIGLAIPADADTRHHVLSDGLHWFRISAEADAQALNDLLAVDAQAARATFVDAGNDPQFLATPLPAGTISKLVVPDPAIKKIVQPYSSFGGRPAEAPDAFATRVSERLRHKDRAVCAFDYESLVLEAFPQLYRAKCISTAALVRDGANRIIADNEVEPGAVMVITVPWTHGRNARNPLRPYADQALLAGVETFLAARISPFVRLEVQNPKFEEVQTAFKVRFHRDIADIDFYIDALNTALVEFLTPWAREGGGEINFGGRLWKSSLIDFVEERPEVDFVTDFQLYHKPDADAGSGRWTPVDVELIEATTARSILVSAPHHLISEVSRNG